MSAQQPVYIVYHPADRAIVDQYLAIAKQTNVDYWDDSKILPGQEWRKLILERLQQAPAFMIFLSPDLLASSFELPTILEMAKNQNRLLLVVPVRPVILRAPFTEIQPLHPFEKPLKGFTDIQREVALNQIAGKVAQAVAGLKENPAPNASAPTPQVLAPLRLTRLSLRHIRCFEKLDLAFHKVSNFTLLLGDNATGKTSILRAIALGLCQESSATYLVNVVPGSFLMSGHDSGSIEIDLVDSDDNHYSIRTELTRMGRDVQVRQVTKPAAFPLKRLFVCAYGTERSSYAIGYAKAYNIRDAVANLFDYKTELFDPEAVLRAATPQAQHDLSAKIRAVLRLADEHQMVSAEGQFQLQGPWGQQPFKALSDGYRGTIQWLLDLLGRHMLAYGDVGADQVQGIVLVDEIDQHLHPKWQQHFLEDLAREFPACQFVATTHSPLIAANLGMVAPSNRLWCLNRSPQGVEIQPGPSLTGHTVDQILGSVVFDYVIQANPELADVLREASKLADLGEKRTDEQERRYRSVVAVIETAIPPEGATPIERDARAAFHERLFAQLDQLKASVYGGSGDQD